VNTLATAVAVLLAVLLAVLIGCWVLVAVGILDAARLVAAGAAAVVDGVRGRIRPQPGRRPIIVVDAGRPAVSGRAR
jgi:hypothetical protein